MKTAEIIFVILMILPIIPMGVFGQWRLFWVFMTFYLCFGLQEWLSVAQTGKSISQHFWVFYEAHPIKAQIILGFMAIMWAALINHFRKVKKSKDI